jgi:hypothetical protein
MHATIQGLLMPPPVKVTILRGSRDVDLQNEFQANITFRFVLCYDFDIDSLRFSHPINKLLEETNLSLAGLGVNLLMNT